MLQSGLGILILTATLMVWMTSPIAAVTSQSTTVVTSQRTTFRAAVYEHAVIIPNPFTATTRAAALKAMEKNLHVFRAQANLAKQQGADILVFPEDGLYGVFLGRSSIYPFLETIPDPRLVNWSPCVDPGRYPNTEVTHALSCMARNNSMYVVANMGDKHPCDVITDPKCPPDGRYQYSTAVAFSPDGRLLARYHKAHLFGMEPFDTPTPEIIFFDTPFGRVGLCVCFDVLFFEPAVAMVTKHNVTTLAFPTAWMDALPLLSAIGFHSSFARGLGVNFLAANIHLPALRFHGSGVYSPEGMKTFDYNHRLFSDGKLLLADLEVLGSPKPSNQEQIYVNKKRSNVYFSENIIHPNMPSSKRKKENDVTVKRMILSDNGEQDKLFFAYLFGDRFSFQALKAKSGLIKVCQGEVCCELNYVKNGGEQRDGGMVSPQKELFAFGAFDGLHTKEGQYYFQICTLVKCADARDKSSCGTVTLKSRTIFKKLEIRGHFQTGYIYPQVVLATPSLNLALAESNEWQYRNETLSISPNVQKPILSAALFGRDYTRDGVITRKDHDSYEVKEVKDLRSKKSKHIERSYLPVYNNIRIFPVIGVMAILTLLLFFWVK